MDIIEIAFVIAQTLYISLKNKKTEGAKIAAYIFGVIAILILFGFFFVETEKNTAAYAVINVVLTLVPFVVDIIYNKK